MLTIGFMSCIHGNYKNVRKLVKIYNNVVDLLVVNGDLGDNFDEMGPLAKELLCFKKQIILMPGSHEPKNDFNRFCKLFKRKNVFKCIKPEKVWINNHALVFLPGSDWMSVDKGFQIIKHKKSTNNIYLPDLSKLLNNDCVLISHIPLLMKGKNAVDLACFGEYTKNILITERKNSKVIVKDILPKGSRSPLDKARLFKKQGLPVKIKTANVGNKDLTKLVKRKNVKKFICSHIHESGGRATNIASKPIKQNVWVEELFYNVGSVNEGKAGIIFLDENKIKYRNFIL